MLPAELVDVRLVPGVDATVRSLAAVGVVVLSAMAGGWRCLCSLALPVAQAKLHRAWSYSTIPTCERRPNSLELREPLRWLHVRRQRHLVSEPRAYVRADSLREILVRRQPAGLRRSSASCRRGKEHGVHCAALRQVLYTARCESSECTLFAGRQATYVSVYTTAETGQ